MWSYHLKNWSMHCVISLKEHFGHIPSCH
jgi:hypothetical protein